MQEANLLLEVGTQALNDLSVDEKDAILLKYSDGEEKLAGMRIFSILMKKFKSDYRMGRMYEDLSQKYETYRRLYYEYAHSVKAGKLSVDPDTQDRSDVERYKFVSPTR